MHSYTSLFKFKVVFYLFNFFLFSVCMIFSADFSFVSTKGEYVSVTLSFSEHSSLNILPTMMYIYIEVCLDRREDRDVNFKEEGGG